MLKLALEIVRAIDPFHTPSTSLKETFSFLGHHREGLGFELRTICIGDDIKVQIVIADFRLTALYVVFVSNEVLIAFWSCCYSVFGPL